MKRFTKELSNGSTLTTTIKGGRFLLRQADGRISESNITTLKRLGGEYYEAALELEELDSIYNS